MRQKRRTGRSGASARANGGSVAEFVLSAAPIHPGGELVEVLQVGELLVRSASLGHIAHRDDETLDQAVLAQIPVRGLDQDLAVVRAAQRAEQHPVTLALERLPHLDAV